MLDVLGGHFFSDFDSWRRKVAVLDIEEVTAAFLVGAFEATIFGSVGGQAILNANNLAFETLRAEIRAAFQLQQELTDEG